MNRVEQACRPGLVFRAIEFAARAHAGQYRKGTCLPYIIHPLSVARLLIEQGFDEELAAAGVLHDTLEDTPATYEQLRRRFGSRVAELVRHASEEDKTASWQARKQRTVAAIRSAPLDAVIVEVADKLDNIRSIAADHARLGDAVWKRFNSPRARQSWYYRELVEAFRVRLARGPGAPLARAFAREVDRVFGRVQRPGRKR
jgi:(p)ppGpp synthase/HD superfamily hydrolase